MYWTRRNEQAASAKAATLLERHHLASAMHRGVARDAIAQNRIEDALRERTGELPTLEPPQAAAPVPKASSLEEVVAENVVRTRTLQTELDHASRHPSLPERMRDWMRRQVVAMENRNAALRRLLFGEELEPRPRMRRSSRRRGPTPLQPALTRREIAAFIVSTTVLCAALGVLGVGTAQALGALSVGFALSLVVGALAGGTIGLLCSGLAASVPITWHLRRELRDAQSNARRRSRSGSISG